MPHSRIDGKEIDRRGYELYEQGIRRQVEIDDNIGKIVVIDVETGAYEVDTDARAATDRAFSKHPDAALLALQIGYNAVEGFGGDHKGSNGDYRRSFQAPRACRTVCSRRRLSRHRAIINLLRPASAKPDTSTGEQLLRPGERSSDS